MWNTFSVVSKFDIFPCGIRNHFTAMCQSIIKPDLNDILYKCYPVTSVTQSHNFSFRIPFVHKLHSRNILTHTHPPPSSQTPVTSSDQNNAEYCFFLIVQICIRTFYNLQLNTILKKLLRFERVLQMNVFLKTELQSLCKVCYFCGNVPC